MPTGIRKRHSRSCVGDGNCSCSPTWEASAYSAADRRKIRKTFATLSEARAWRADAQRAIGRGEQRAPTRITLRDAGAAWLDAAERGEVRNRSGDPYKPSTLVGYRSALERVYRDLGGRKLSDIQRRDVQDLADRLRSDGLSPSSVRNMLMPLRAIFRRAVSRGEVAINPTTRLELPAVRGRRDRFASPQEAATLIEALDPRDRAVWATALYAGLRRGELMALDWSCVDLASGVIRVERAYDPKAGAYVEPKSRAGRRRVPIVGVLRDVLLEHKLVTGRAEGLVFGADGRTPFVYSSLRERSLRRWKKAGLAPLGLHGARHTAASFMIAAGVNAKAITSYMGHASISTTFDLYGHLMPGNEDEAAALLDRFIASANEERARTGA